MTFQSALNVARSVSGIDVVVIIDGIPVAFSTRSGIDVDCAGLGIFQGEPSSLTTVNAIARPPKVDGSNLDQDQLMVLPGGAAVSLRSSTLWDKYFETRRTPATQLVSALSLAGTTLSVQQSSGFSASQVAYVDREAILIGSVVGNTFTGCTRNYAALTGTRGATHQGWSRVQVSPIAIEGRYAEMWLHLEGNWKLYRRLIVDSIHFDGSPGIGTWELTFKTMMAIIDRNIAVGADGYAIESIESFESGDASPEPMLRIRFPADSGLDIGPTGDTGLFIAVQVGGETIMERVVSVVLGDVYTYGGPLRDALARVYSSQIGGPWWTVRMGDGGVTARLCYRMSSAPALDWLRVVTSCSGDGTNGVWDVLNGATSDAVALSGGEQERRFGAAIYEALIDVDGIVEQFGSITSEGWRYFVGANGQENLRDFTEEVCWALQVYLCERDGKITMRKLSGISNSIVADDTVTDDDIARDASFKPVDDKREALHSMSVECNYDPLSGSFKGTVNIRDMRFYEAMRDAARVSRLERKGLVVARPSRGALLGASGVLAASYAGLTSRFNKMMHRRMRGIRKFEIVLPARFLLRQAGDVLSVTSEALKAFDGGTLEGNLLEIVSSGGLDFASGRVSMTVWDTWSTKAIAPASRVASWNAGTSTLTLSTGHRFGGGVAPGRLWAAGWGVRVMDASATPPFSSWSNSVTVAAVTDTTVQLTGVLGMTPAVGDLLVFSDYDNASSSAQNTSSRGQRDYVFMADSNARLGAADDAADTLG